MESTEATSPMQRFHSTFGLPKQHNQFDPPIFSSPPLRQSFQHFTHENTKKPGIPPSHPHFPRSSRYSQLTPSRSASQQPGNQNFNPSQSSSHSRALSQPTFFTLDCLPPLSPLPYRESLSTSTTEPDSVDVSMEEMNSNSESLPPRKGHRRPNSDIPLGFVDMIQSSLQLIPIKSQGNLDKLDKQPIQSVKHEFDWNGDGNNNSEGVGERESEGEVVDDLLTAYVNLDNIDTLNSHGTEDKDRDSRASGTKTNGGDSSDNEVESSINGITNSMHGTRLSFPIERREGVKRSAGGEIVPATRHYRSVSMDSFMGSLHFGEESPKIPPPSVGNRMAQHSPCNSMDGNSTKFSLEFVSSEFTGAELKKIMANEKLAEIASSDPKRAKRILANRQSAARSKERKLQYISELEHKVQTLQTEATTLSAQLTILQRDFAGLTSQNNEWKFRLRAMEQQAQLRDALHDALTVEVQHLKLAAAELSGETHPSDHMAQQISMNHQVFQLQHQQPTQVNMYQLQRRPQHNNQLQPLQQNGEPAQHESNQ